jgi:hypothetical protein
MELINEKGRFTKNTPAIKFSKKSHYGPGQALSIPGS